MKWWVAPALGILFGPSIASAVPCAPGTLQDYIELAAGCTLGSVQVGGFTTWPGQSFATPIDPALVQVTPTGTALAPELLLTYAATAATGELRESFFQLQVSGANLVASAMAMADATATVDGAVTASEDVCADGTFIGPVTGCPADPATLILFATESDSWLSDAVGLPAASFADLFVDVVVDGGLEGSAGLGTVTLGFTLVPEPASALLLALGLVPFALPRSRR